MELESGEQLASVVEPQPAGGLRRRPDVAHRLRPVRRRATSASCRPASSACSTSTSSRSPRESGVLAKWIYKVVVVGNTCMHHLLLGIDPSYVGLAPYAPVMRHPLVAARARAVPQAGARGARLPAADRGRLRGRRRGRGGAGHPHRRGARRCASRWTSAPTARCCWARASGCGPARRPPAPRSRAPRSATACARRGRRHRPRRRSTTATAPAHDRRAAAQGICGSGLVDAVAALLDAGVIDWTGLIDVDARDRLPARVARRASMMRGEERLVSCSRGRARPAREREIVLTQDDVRQVQLCKGAIASGVAMLQHVAGVPPERVAELMLAGGFGNYLSVRSALRIGLIPPWPPERDPLRGQRRRAGRPARAVSEARAGAEAIAAGARSPRRDRRSLHRPPRARLPRSEAVHLAAEGRRPDARRRSSARVARRPDRSGSCSRRCSAPHGRRRTRARPRAGRRAARRRSSRAAPGYSGRSSSSAPAPPGSTSNSTSVVAGTSSSVGGPSSSTAPSGSPEHLRHRDALAGVIGGVQDVVGELAEDVLDEPLALLPEDASVEHDLLRVGVGLLTQQLRLALGSLYAPLRLGARAGRRSLRRSRGRAGGCRRSPRRPRRSPSGPPIPATGGSRGRR